MVNQGNRLGFVNRPKPQYSTSLLINNEELIIEKYIFSLGIQIQVELKVFFL